MEEFEIKDETQKIKKPRIISFDLEVSPALGYFYPPTWERTMNECGFTRCERPVHGRGLCKSHGQQLRRGQYLHELHPAKPTLAEALVLFTDRSGECWQWTGARCGEGYASVTTVDGTTRAHRASYEFYVGPIPQGALIDHKCRNKMCVNPEHLQPATYKQNAENVGVSAANTSGIRGVSWDAQNQRWGARLMHDRKNYWVGRFDRLEDAERAVIAKRNELFTNNLADRSAA